MIQFKSDQGDISVSSAVFSNITGMAATNCYGVKGMAYRSMTDGLVHLLRREAMSKGVSVTLQRRQYNFHRAPHHCGKRREPSRGLPLHYERSAVYGHKEHRR
jgi:hypothetical protein